jgi:hypothetical protein
VILATALYNGLSIVMLVPGRKFDPAVRFQLSEPLDQHLELAIGSRVLKISVAEIPVTIEEMHRHFTSNRGRIVSLQERPTLQRVLGLSDVAANAVVARRAWVIDRIRQPPVGVELCQDIENVSDQTCVRIV